LARSFLLKSTRRRFIFPADVASLEEAVGLSLAYSYILDTKYPEALKFVYLFLNTFSALKISLCAQQELFRVYFLKYGHLSDLLVRFMNKEIKSVIFNNKNKISLLPHLNTLIALGFIYSTHRSIQI